MIEKELLLTFDYELFLGGDSGTVENCLIKPTNALLKVLKKHSFSAIFFVDTLYLYRLKELTNDAAKNDYKKIISQLQELIDQKCYVFYHLHPHWLDAQYNEDTNRWDLSDKSRFALCNLTFSERTKVFEDSNNIIREIYYDRKLPDYFGFRAGGLYAQPFSNYKDLMKKNAIKFDFSVLRGGESIGENNLYSFDYTQFPPGLIYHFSNEVNIEDKEGEFIEVSLNQFKMRGVSKILNGIYYRLNAKKKDWKRYGDGKASGNIVQATEKTSKLFAEETYSVELLNKMKVNFYLRHWSKEKCIHIISHPKLCSPANIDAFDIFLRKSRQRFDLKTDIFDMISQISVK